MRGFPAFLFFMSRGEGHSPCLIKDGPKSTASVIYPVMTTDFRIIPNPMG